MGCCGQTASPEAQRGLPEEGHLSHEHRNGRPCEQAEERSRQRVLGCSPHEEEWAGGAGRRRGQWPGQAVSEVRGAGPPQQGTGLDVPV